MNKELSPFKKFLMKKKIDSKKKLENYPQKAIEYEEYLKKNKLRVLEGQSAQSLTGKWLNKKTVFLQRRSVRKEFLELQRGSSKELI